VIAATFTGDEMKLCVTQGAEGATVCFTITADYALTKEGLVHGVITGIDVGCKTDPQLAKKGIDGHSVAMELAEMSAGLQELVDCPFSFRIKHTSAGVMVSNLKFAGAGWISSKEIAMLCGMFKPAADGKVPAPKLPLQTLYGGMTLPSPRYLEHHPQYFPPDPAHPLPRELAGHECPTCGVQRIGIDFSATPVPAMPCPVVPAGCVEPAPVRMMPPPLPPGTPVGACGVPVMCPPACPPVGWCPPPPPNVPFAEFGIMADVFTQMLEARLPAPPPCPVPTHCPPPCRARCSRRVTSPPRRPPALLSPGRPTRAPYSGRSTGRGIARSARSGASSRSPRTT
jgi:hypothetical protein